MKRIGIVLIGIAIVVGIGVIVLWHGDWDRSPQRTESATEQHSESAPVKERETATTMPDMNNVKEGKVINGSQATAYEEQFPTNLQEHIRSVAGLDANKGYTYRFSALRQLGSDLSRKNIEGLYAFLHARYEDHKDEMGLLEFESVRNDTLDLLLRQTQLPPDLGKNMVAIFRDHEQNKVWRDYCVQHFAPYCKAKWNNGDISLDDPDWIAVSNAFFDAVKETDSTIAGTALIGMEMLSQTHTVLSRETVGQLASTLALDDNCGEPARITALCVCGQLKKTEILPTVRFLAQTAETIPLQIAAIATLGDLGDSIDKEYLETLLTAGNERLHPAAKSALERLTNANPKTRR